MISIFCNQFYYFYFYMNMADTYSLLFCMVQGIGS